MVREVTCKKHVNVGNSCEAIQQSTAEVKRYQRQLQALQLLEQNANGSDLLRRYYTIQYEFL